jgi:hypothetical protein
LRFYKAGNPMTDTHGYAQRTRFINDAVAPFFVEIAAVAEPAPEDDAVQAPPPNNTTSADIRASVRKLWT